MHHVYSNASILVFGNFQVVFITNSCLSFDRVKFTRIFSSFANFCSGYLSTSCTDVSISPPSSPSAELLHLVNSVSLGILRCCHMEMPPLTTSFSPCRIVRLPLSQKLHIPPAPHHRQPHATQRTGTMAEITVPHPTGSNSLTRHLGNPPVMHLAISIISLGDLSTLPKSSCRRTPQSLNLLCSHSSYLPRME